MKKLILPPQDGRACAFRTSASEQASSGHRDGAEYSGGLASFRLEAPSRFMEKIALATIPAEDREGAMHCMPPKSQLIVAAAGPAANALLCLAVVIWMIGDVAYGVDLGFREFFAWIGGINQLLVAARALDFDLGNGAEAAIVAHWGGVRLAGTATFLGVANFLALAVNLPPTPLRDGWHIQRAWREMHGIPAISQEEWDIKRIPDRRNIPRVFIWVALPAAIATSIALLL